MSDAREEDRRAIHDLVRRQFASLTWSADRDADWQSCGADFLPDAVLYPSARPLRPLTVAAFVERMQGLASSEIRSFDETVLGTEIRVFGNVAVASVGCETVVDENEVERTVEMMLLVKDAGRWRIAAQGWDKAGDSDSPEDLLEDGSGRV